MPLPHLRESKTLLDSGFHDLDSEFHVLYIIFVGGTCFLDSNLDSAGRRKVFPDSEFYRQKSGFLYMGEAIHFTAIGFKRKLILGDDQHECTRRGSTLNSLTVVGLLYASIMRHAHEPNCLLTYYAMLRPFQSRSFPGTITGELLDYE